MHFVLQLTVRMFRNACLRGREFELHDFCYKVDVVIDLVVYEFMSMSVAEVFEFMLEFHIDFNWLRRWLYLVLLLL